MSQYYPTHLIKFCPFCGSEVLTHLKESIFLCGHLDPALEAVEKAAHKNARCNRTFRVDDVSCRRYFRVIHAKAVAEFGNQHRRRIGRELDKVRVAIDD
jgi:hypothetical protein